MLLCFVSSHAKEMENKQFWKVFYEHLERAAVYAGKSELLHGVLTVTKLIVNDMWLCFFMCPKFMCDGRIPN